MAWDDYEPRPEPQERVTPAYYRDDVESLCRHLADRVEGNGSPRPQVTKWWKDAAMRMLDSERRTEEEIHYVIDWCQDSDFWCSAILTMPKLRANYDAIRLQATRRNGREVRSRRQDETDEQFNRMMERAARKDREDEAAGNGIADQVYPRGLPPAAD